MKKTLIAIAIASTLFGSAANATWGGDSYAYDNSVHNTNNTLVSNNNDNRNTKNNNNMQGQLQEQLQGQLQEQLQGQQQNQTAIGIGGQGGDANSSSVSISHGGRGGDANIGDTTATVGDTLATVGDTSAVSGDSHATVNYTNTVPERQHITIDGPKNVPNVDMSNVQSTTLCTRPLNIGGSGTFGGIGLGFTYTDDGCVVNESIRLGATVSGSHPEILDKAVELKMIQLEDLERKLERKYRKTPSVDGGGNAFLSGF